MSVFTFRVRQPLFRLDDPAIGWDGMFDAPTDGEDPADDDQPAGESEDEDLEADGSAKDGAEEDQQDSESEEGDESDDADEGEEGEDDQDDDAPFNDDTEVDLGEGQTVKFKELKDGYLRQSDYTKKTQALAEDRKKLEAEQTELKPARDMNAFLQANPYLREQIDGFIHEFTNTGSISMQDALADAAYGQYLNALMAQNQQLQTQLQEATGKLGELEFTGTMKDLTNQLKAEYGELATEEYLTSLEKRAKEEKLPLTVLREIADANLAKQKLEQVSKKSKKAAKEAETQTYQKMREKSENNAPRPKKKGSTPNNRKTIDPAEPLGWDDVF